VRTQDREEYWRTQGREEYWRTQGREEGSMVQDYT